MEETYKLSLTGAQIDAKLALIDSDGSTVKIKANKVTAEAATTATDSNLTLVTKGYVDAKIKTYVDENILNGAW
jgi:hypothetical protein